MKDCMITIPVALQHMILKRICGAMLAIAAAACFFIQSGSAVATVPVLLAALLLAATAVYTGWLAVKGHCLELNCTVLEIEKSALRGRTKALLVETQDVVLRLPMRGSLRTLGIGDSITVYVSDTTPLYDWRGLHQLSSYLVAVPQKAQNQRHSAGPQ